MAKLQPVPLTLTFELDNIAVAPAGPGTTGTSETYYIDLSQCKSLVARKFHRQGLLHAVAGMRLSSVNVAPGTTAQVSTAPSGSIMITKLPSTWPVSNGWHKAFSHWKRQQDEAIDESGAQSAVATYRDFKIFMDSEHVQQFVDAAMPVGQTQNLLPSSFGGVGVYSQANVGEWQPSLIVVPNSAADATGSDVDPTEYYLHMVGGNFGPGSVSRGIIDGYQYSRAYPQSPDPVSPALDSGFNWMRDMFDVGNDNVEIIQNATDRNDELPYPQVDYPGGDTQLPSLECSSFDPISGSTVGGVTYIKGNTFPCGLIRIDITNFDQTYDMRNILQVDLVPGHKDGYLTEPMQDM